MNPIAHFLRCTFTAHPGLICRADLVWLDGIFTFAACVGILGILALAACLLPRTEAEAAACGRAFGWRGRE